MKGDEIKVNCLPCKHCKEINPNKLRVRLECALTGTEIELAGFMSAKPRGSCPLVKKEEQDQHKEESRNG